MSETVIIDIDRIVKQFKDVYIVEISGERHPFAIDDFIDLDVPNRTIEITELEASRRGLI